MRFLRAICCLLVLPLVCCFQAAAGDGKDDLKKLEGEWVEIYWENGNGSKFTRLPGNSSALIVKGRTMIFKDGEEEKSRGAFTVDPKKNPKALDITWAATKDEAEATELLVYSIDGDRLKICYPGDDGKRPGSVSPVAKSGQECHVYKRKNASPQAVDKVAKNLPKELKELQGRWDVVSQEDDGMKVPPLPKEFEGIGKLTVVIKEDKATIGTPDVDDEEFAFTLNAKKDPKEIDWVGIDEVTKKTIKASGIYQLQGDTLRICFSFDEGKRPTTFDAKKGTKQNLWILKREK